MRFISGATPNSPTASATPTMPIAAPIR
jgi:hypothetical protein